jgi:esterase/lipase superfamily enzyme
MRFAVSFLFCSLSLVAAEFQRLDSKTDADGVLRIHIKSEFQPEPSLIRILAPDAAKAAQPLRILFVLPVEPKEEKRFGDGFEEFRKLNVHAKHGLIVVAPTFNQIPWYADHPTDPARRHESHFIRAVLPLIDELFPGEKRQRLLLGFSKSGYGAYAMLLRHPELFYAASAWDSPLMKTEPNQFQMSEVFGTQAQFEKYQLTTLFPSQAKTLQSRKRLYLAGHDNFLKHTQDAHALLESLQIPHDYREGPKRPHVWGSGWMIESVDALVLLSQLEAAK